jgi:CRP-like cAMP-binding protein
MATDEKDKTLDLLGAAERAALLSVAKPVSFAAGETIFHQGDDADSLLVIEAGSARVVRYAPDGKDAILAFLGAGDVVGEIACLGGLPRTATVEAVSEVSAKAAPRGELFALMRKEPELALGFVRLLCARLAQTDSLVMSLSALKMRARLASGLLQLARRHGIADRQGVKIDLTLTQREVGAFVGLSRENVSRILNEWRSGRLIAMNPQAGEIVLRDLDRLEEIAEAED